MTGPVKRPDVRKETDAIRSMIHQRLKARALVESLPNELDAHLDEDAIGAFVEGRLHQTESLTIVSHLVACTFCRHTTAQLIRLESEFEPENESTTSEAGAGRLRLFLERMASPMTSSPEEDVVFAYQNPVEPEVTQTTPGESDQTGSVTKSDLDAEEDQ